VTERATDQFPGATQGITPKEVRGEIPHRITSLSGGRESSKEALFSSKNVQQAP
jgi:hypothetical protein